MQTSDESNQSNVDTTGHVAGGAFSDPHLSTEQGMSIGLSTNFGIEHYGVVAGMHEGKDSGINATDEK